MTSHPKVRGIPLGDVFSTWTRAQIESRFWAKVDKNGPVPQHHPELGPCYVWTGDKTGSGYGLLKRTGAHRVAMWLDTGEEPGDREVLHACDNPPCIRRSHLRFGTHRDNMADMAERQRAHRVLKVPDAEVEALRQRYSAGVQPEVLAAEYGISLTQVHRIAHGKTRKLTPISREWRDKGFKVANQRLSADDRDEIRRRAAAGESRVDLARTFKVSAAHVSALVNGRVRDRSKPSGPRRGRPPLAPEVVREIRQRAERSGVTQGQIAREFGIDRGTVSRILGGLSYRDVA